MPEPTKSTADEVIEEILLQVAIRGSGKKQDDDYIAKAKTALTQLIKDLVADAKPELKEIKQQIRGDMDSLLHNQEAIWSEQYVTEFEQNLLKLLEATK